MTQLYGCSQNWWDIPILVDIASGVGYRRVVTTESDTRHINQGRRKQVLMRANRDLRKHASPQRIAELNLIGNNSGNSVFAHAVHRALSTASNDITIGTVGRKSDLAGHINERYDQYVIPLANAFRRSFIERLDQYSEIIEGLRIPVVVIGVGAQLDDRATGIGRLPRIRPNVERFMRAVLKRSASVGVRGEVTYNYLRDLGFSDDEVHIIGCPSLFQFGEALAVRPYDGLDSDSLVSINISPYRDKMGAIASVNAARYPRLQYVPQDLGTLRVLLHGSDPEPGINYAPGIPYRISDPLIRDGRTQFFVDPTTWEQWLATRDVSFGTRIHGNIAALLGGTPSFVLAHDSRTLELAEYHEIPHRRLDDVPDDVDPRDLFEQADFSAFHRNHPERFDNYVRFLNNNGIDHIFRGHREDSAAVRNFDRQIELARNKRPVSVSGGFGSAVSRKRKRLREVGAAILPRSRRKS